MYIVNVSILLPFTGRLLFLTCTPETSTDKDVEHCIESGPKPSSSGATTADMGTQNPTDVGAPKSEAMEVESSKKSEAVPLAANTSPSAKTAAACGSSVTTPPAPPKVSSVNSGDSPLAKNRRLKAIIYKRTIFTYTCNILIIVFWQVVRAKLTKQQREAMRLERERQRAERERQRAQKEREKAEAKARREEEREIRKLEKQRKEEEKKLINS